MSALIPEEPEKHSPARRRRATAFITVACLAVMVLAVGGILSYDEKLQPADDLLPLRPVPKPEENGWEMIQNLWSITPEADKADRAHWNSVIEGDAPWDEALAGRLTSGRESLRADAERALELPEWQWPPPVYQVYGTNFSATSLFYPRYAALQAQILSAHRRGDFADSMKTQRVLTEVHRRNVSGATTLLFSLVNSSSTAYILKPIPHLMEPGGPADDTGWAGLQANMLKSMVTPEDLDEVLRAEVSYLRNVPELHQPQNLGSFSKFASWPPFVRGVLYKKNKTLNRTAAVFRQVMGGWLQPVGSREESWWVRFGGEEKELTLADRFHPNALGLDAVRSQQRIIAILDNHGRFHNAAFRLMAVRIALHRWQLRHGGEFPATLEELIPEYMAEIPADPYDGKPLRWDAKAGVLYALGRDWVDAPPVFQSDGWINFSHEPAIRLNRPAPPPPP